MASSTTGVSQRMAMATAAAITGLVLAGGISIATVAGWVRPAQTVNETAQTSPPGQASLPAVTSTSPHVVLVPIAPAATSAQPPAAGASVGGVEASIGPSTAAGAFVASRHTERARSEGGTALYGERDDD